MDSAADFLVPNDRQNIVYPSPFGRDATPEEAKIAELDGRTGASLKVTLWGFPVSRRMLSFSREY